MSEPILLTLSFVTGIVLGIVFFGGLWWTIRHGLNSARPALWFFLSLVLRTAVVVSGFYLVGHSHWSHLCSCLLGFILVRLVLIKRLPPALTDNSTVAQEHPHAS